MLLWRHWVCLANVTFHLPFSLWLGYVVLFFPHRLYSDSHCSGLLAARFWPWREVTRLVSPLSSQKSSTAPCPYLYGYTELKSSSSLQRETWEAVIKIHCSTLNYKSSRCYSIWLIQRSTVFWRCSVFQSCSYSHLSYLWRIFNYSKHIFSSRVKQLASVSWTLLLSLTLFLKYLKMLV